MIFLKSLAMRDFKSYDEEEIEFVAGRNVIHGLNGAGKTTILSAILYALLGRVQRLGKTVPLKDLVRKGKKSFSVTLEFEINGEEYTVERTNYLGKKEPIARLFKNNDLICEKQSAVTSDITDLLRIDSTTFENVIYIGQGEIPQIATELPSWRKKLFDQFLNLDVYDTIFTKFRDAESKNKYQIESLGQLIKEFTKIIEPLPEEENRLIESRKRLEKRKEEEIQFKKEFEQIKKEYSAEEKKYLAIEKLEVSLKNKNEQIKKKDASIGEKQREIEKITEEKVSLEPRDLSKFVEIHKNRKDTFEKKEEELDDLIKTQENLELELKSVQKRIEDNENNQATNKGTIESNKKSVLADLPELKRLDSKVWKSSIASKLEISTKKADQLRFGRSGVIEKEKELEKLKAEYQSKGKNITLIEEDLRKQLKSAEEIDEKWEKSLDEYRKIDFQEKLKKFAQEITQKDGYLNNLTQEMAVLRSRLESKDTELKEMGSLEKGGKCPQCKQLVTEEHKQKIIQDIKDEISEIQVEIKKKDIEIKESQAQLTEKKEREEEFKEKTTKFQELERISENILLYRKRIESEKSEYETIRTEIDKIIIDKTPKQYDSEIAEEDKKINFYSAAVANIENIERMQDSLSDLITQYKEFKEKEGEISKNYKPDILNKARDEMKEIKISLSILRDLIPEIGNLIDHVNEKNTFLTEEAKLNSELVEKRKDFDSKHFETLKNQKDQINQKIGEVKNDISTLTKEIIPNLRLSIDNMKLKKKELGEKQVQLEKERKKSNLIQIIRDFCRQITPVLRLQKTSQISAKATEIFMDLVGISGEFDGIKVTENYDLYVTRYGVDEDITILSGGEQVISCLAIRLAISEILANQGLILLDEPTSHLDEMHVKDLVEVFELYTPVRQLITVTHDDEFEKIADALIQVYKENGVSQIL